MVSWIHLATNLTQKSGGDFISAVEFCSKFGMVAPAGALTLKF